MILGPKNPVIVDQLEQSRMVNSVILVSVMPESYALWMDTMRMGPLQEDFVRTDWTDAQRVRHWACRPMVQYVMPEAPENGEGPHGWTALRVYDVMMKREYLSQDSRSGVEYNTQWTPAKEEAERLRQQWGRFPHEGLVGVGLAIVADESEITSAFIADLQHQKREAFRQVVYTADGWADSPQQRQNISPRHRFAARSLGLSRPWAESQMAQKSCPNCANAINRNARGCMHCKVSLTEYYVKEIQEDRMTLDQVKHFDPAVHVVLAGAPALQKNRRPRRAPIPGSEEGSASEEMNASALSAAQPGMRDTETPMVL